MWAARQCPGQRVFFCYPTTGTATEGFRGYLFDEETAESRLGAKLFHSRAAIDFEVILNADRDDDDTEDRIASLDAWGTRLVCCTVDTVLGIMQNHRRSLYAWPALAQSAFVFDEIHAYDEKLFGTLLQFLDKLTGVKVLLMTASLPAPRLQAITEILEDQNDKLLTVGGPPDLEELPRYRREVCSPAFRRKSAQQHCQQHSEHIPPEGGTTNISDELHQRIIAEVSGGGRVLWICNVVDRAMAIAGTFAGLSPLIYHSRFRYEDRVDQHRAVMSAFDPKSKQGALAVCTQVAEMSLDISATLLVTETCPVPPLIQRLGRLNRHARPAPEGQPNPPTMPFIVVQPLKDDGTLQTLPYDTKKEGYGDWPAQTGAWLERLGDDNISQKDLAAAWEQVAADEEPPSLGDCPWIEGGPATLVDTLRDSSSNVTVVLAGKDANRVSRSTSELTRVGIPMPIPRFADNWTDWRTRHGYVIPPESVISYDKQRGAQWLR